MDLFSSDISNISVIDNTTNSVLNETDIINHTYNNITDNIKETTILEIKNTPLPKKRTRKSKKQTEKELLNQFLNEMNDNNEIREIIDITQSTQPMQPTKDNITYEIYKTTYSEDDDTDNDASFNESIHNLIFKETQYENKPNTKGKISTEKHTKTTKQTSSQPHKAPSKQTKQTKQVKTNEYLTGEKTDKFDKPDKKIVKPKNPSQELYVNMLNNKEKKILFAVGPAGTGKTLFATQYAMRQFIAGNFDKILFTRPTVSVDEDIGYLPGTIEEKLAPWLRPIFDILYEYMTVKEVQTLVDEKTFEMAPIGYLRGRTFKRTFIIADEMQNCTQNQMKMLLTRLGENSRMVVTGDLDQHDRVGEINGMADFLRKLRKKRSSSIGEILFSNSDILREPVIKEVLEIYEVGEVGEPMVVPLRPLPFLGKPIV